MRTCLAQVSSRTRSKRGPDPPRSATPAATQRKKMAYCCTLILLIFQLGSGAPQGIGDATLLSHVPQGALTAVQSTTLTHGQLLPILDGKAETIWTVTTLASPTSICSSALLQGDVQRDYHCNMLQTNSLPLGPADATMLAPDPPNKEGLG